MKRSSATSPFPLLLAGLAILAAFVFRVYRLNAQSLWYDEGVSAFMTGRGVTEILAAAAGDIHPPLYYLLLRGWAVLAGSSEFSLRFLSLFLGVVLVAMLYLLGREVASPREGAVAALLAALSPILVYYSQEARMYMLMATLALLSTLLLWRILAYEGHPSGRGSQRVLVVYVVATSALLYTQYFSFALLLFHNLYFAIRGRRFPASLWGRWAVAQGAIALLYLPWLSQVWGQVAAWQSSAPPVLLWPFVRDVFLAFTFGRSWPTVASPWAWFFLFLAGVGMAGLSWGQQRSKGNAPLFSLLFLLVPLAAMYLLSLRRPMPDIKLLLLALPPYLLLLGVGVVAVGRVVERLGLARARAALALAIPVAILAALAGALWSPLSALYFDPAYARDDYRGLARYIESSSSTGDAILLDAPGQREVFGYYYRGEVPFYALPLGRPADKERTVAELEAVAATHPRLWGVFWAAGESDPQGVVQGWLNQRGYQTQHRWFGGVQLVLYVFPGSGFAREDAPQTNFGDFIRLLRYRLEGGQPSATGGPSVVAGEALRLSLAWQAIGRVEGAYKVFTHLLDEDGLLWGQHDAEPGGGSRPTTTWAVGDRIVDNHGLPVLPGTPPGRYLVEIGLYATGTGERLPILGDGGKVVGDHLVLGSVEVRRPAAPPSLASLSPHRSAQVSVGPLRLVGYSLSLRGDTLSQERFRRGQEAQLTLFWQVVSPPQGDYPLALQLRDAEGHGTAVLLGRPLGGRFPTSHWEAGEVVRDQHLFPLSVGPGQYRLFLIVEDQAGKALAGDGLFLQKIEVE